MEACLLHAARPFLGSAADIGSRRRVRRQAARGLPGLTVGTSVMSAADRQ
jgi:hypothetical protein